MNSIHVTSVDNELYVIAFNATASYRVGQVQSGSGFTVDYTINLAAGEYNAPAVLQGQTVNVSTTIMTTLPAGQYSLCLVGLNWGAGAAFAATVNGVAVKGTIASTSGVAWTPALIAITV